MKLSFLVGTICLVFGAVLFLTAPLAALSDLSPGVNEGINSEYEAFLALQDSTEDEEAETFLIFCPPIIYVEPEIELRNGIVGVGFMIVGLVIVDVGGLKRRPIPSDIMHLESG